MVVYGSLLSRKLQRPCAGDIPEASDLGLLARTPADRMLLGVMKEASALLSCRTSSSASRDGQKVASIRSGTPQQVPETAQTSPLGLGKPRRKLLSEMVRGHGPRSPSGRQDSAISSESKVEAPLKVRYGISIVTRLEVVVLCPHNWLHSACRHFNELRCAMTWHDSWGQVSDDKILLVYVTYSKTQSW